MKSILCSILFFASSLFAQQVTLTVRGNSMDPVLKNGQVITFDKAYYKKNKIKKQDIVLIEFSHRKAPIVKRVLAVPGDHLQVKYFDKSSCNVIINKKALVNTKRVTYKLKNKACRLLKLYEIDYKSKIPDESYLVLGENITGTWDASRFGLISKEQIVGKLI